MLDQSTTGSAIAFNYNVDPFNSNTAVTNSGRIVVDILEPINRNELPRPAQLEELVRLSSEGRTRVSRRESARFGWRDAPRRPGYRAVRTR